MFWGKFCVSLVKSIRISVILVILLLSLVDMYLLRMEPALWSTVSVRP